MQLPPFVRLVKCTCTRVAWVATCPFKRDCVTQKLTYWTQPWQRSSGCWWRRKEDACRRSAANLWQSCNLPLEPARSFSTISPLTLIYHLLLLPILILTRKFNNDQSNWRYTDLINVTNIISSVRLTIKRKKTTLHISRQVRGSWRSLLFSLRSMRIRFKQNNGPHIWVICIYRLWSRDGSQLWAGRPAFDSWERYVIFLFSAASTKTRPPSPQSSYPMGTGGCFSGNKVDRASNWPLTSI
jgi:hypothetical protein